MGKLKGKVAVVTGASKGIGAGIAKAFAAEGAAVVVNYASSREGAEKVVSEITGSGGKAVAIGGDVAKAADAKVLIEGAKKAFGRLDVLVNNAGVYEFFPVESFTEAEFHRQFNINVLGPTLLAQEALKHFGPEGGSIINVSSVAAYNSPANSVVYSATKAALDSMTRVLAAELGPPQDPRQLAEPRRGRDRGHAPHRRHRQRFRKEHCQPHCARPSRAARRHRQGGRIPCL
jgi:3-oxoacyl-[acyl-carrier protein] reductase